MLHSKRMGWMLATTFGVSGLAQAELELRTSSYITLNHPAIFGDFQTDAQFGFSLSSMRRQLVIGAPSYDRNGVENAGAIFYLQSAANNQIKPLEWVPGNGRYSQTSTPGATPETNDYFGRTVAITSPCFNCDETKILIGVPFENIGSTIRAGMTHEIIIDSSGIEFNNFFQGNVIDGTPAEWDLFGTAIAWGDFNGDQSKDAAFGVPGDDVLLTTAAGAVHVVMGGSNGQLDPNDSKRWTQGSLFIEGDMGSHENFGSALVVGDFNGDDKSDLAIGVPTDDLGVSRAGSVNVLYGSLDGLTSGGNQLWNQESLGIAGAAEASDQFGSVLAKGDFNGDSVSDLVIGTPLEDIDDIENAGAVQIIYGVEAFGLMATNDLFISQDEPGVSGVSEAEDRFGSALAVGKFNDDNYDDLAIGIPSEDIGDVVNAGAVLILHGSASGIQFNDEYYINGSNLNIPGGIKAGAEFGFALTANDFDNDAKTDLAITITQTASTDDAVVVAYHRLYEDIFEDGFEAN